MNASLDRFAPQPCALPNPVYAGPMTWRVLELFAGLGGWRLAFRGIGSVVAAYDISPHANATYALNHGERPRARELASVPIRELAAHGADTWALSPPCQPTCRMGLKRDLEDPRSKAFLHLLEVLAEAPPERLVLENVAGFPGSQGHTRLVDLLERLGFQRSELLLCPTALGIPNQRPRFYLIAARHPVRLMAPEPLEPAPLAPYLDPESDPDLILSPEEVARFGPGLDLVEPTDKRSTCFIGGYGQRYVGSGSFLRLEDGRLRRFSPAEVARLLGYPEGFRFPEPLPREARYKLLGNGLSLPAARWIVENLISSAPA